MRRSWLERLALRRRAHRPRRCSSLLPFWWVFSSSIKAPPEIIARTPTMFPQSFTLAALREAPRLVRLSATTC